jgi:hypothetical protein
MASRDYYEGMEIDYAEALVGILAVLFIFGAPIVIIGYAVTQLFA